jgi:RNA polymerase sigma-70 factor, ECF subfamily
MHESLAAFGLSDDAVQGAWEIARRGWPNIALDPRAFEAHLATCLRGPDYAADLETLHAADLYLACACLRGDPAAHAALQRYHLSRIGEWIGHVDRSPAYADDIRQQVATILLVGTSVTGPKLVGYTGHGPLGAFVRVIATRTAQKRKKKKSERGHDEPDVNLAAPDLDPELALLKRRFAKEFGEAFKAVLTSLEPDERGVLKLHYLDGLSIEQVAVAYKVSRATAARWLAKARERVVEETQKRLAKKLGRSAPNADSLLAIVKSDLHLSLSKFMR